MSDESNTEVPGKAVETTKGFAEKTISWAQQYTQEQFYQLIQRFHKAGRKK